ncbi:MAG: hypothetical protein ACFE9M_09930 [Promethearchaeota archaeon]
MSEIIVCPVCGFSFKYSDAKIVDGKIVCPMCGHKFKIPSFFNFVPKEFDNRH